MYICLKLYGTVQIVLLTLNPKGSVFNTKTLHRNKDTSVKKRDVSEKEHFIEHWFIPTFLKERGGGWLSVEGDGEALRITCTFFFSATNVQNCTASESLVTACIFPIDYDAIDQRKALWPYSFNPFSRVLTSEILKEKSEQENSEIFTFINLIVDKKKPCNTKW